MSLDQMLQSIISQLPNLAGLVLCILFQQGHIKMLYTRISVLESRIDKLTDAYIASQNDNHHIKVSTGLD